MLVSKNKVIDMAWKAANRSIHSLMRALLVMVGMVVLTLSLVACADQTKVDSASLQASSTATEGINRVILLMGLVSVGLITVAIIAARRLTRYPQYRVRPVPVPLSEPPGNLSPAMAGALLNGGVGISAFVATMIDLARRGFIKIEETSRGKYTFRRLSSQGQSLKPFEQALIDAFFTNEPGKPPYHEVKLQDLNYKLNSCSSTIRTLIWDELEKAELFRAGKVRGCLMFTLTQAAIFLVFVTSASLLEALCIAWNSPTSMIPCATGVILSGANLYVLGWYKTHVTREGAKLHAQLLSYKRYLEHIEQLVDLEEAADLFETHLPYAVAFGIQMSWLKTFAKHVPQTARPGWYIIPAVKQESQSGSTGKASTKGANGNTAPRLTMRGAVSLFNMIKNVANTFIRTEGGIRSYTGSRSGFSSGDRSITERARVRSTRFGNN